MPLSVRGSRGDIIIFFKVNVRRESAETVTEKPTGTRYE
jgi:hypothetical protein